MAIIDDAMMAIEKENPTLKGVLPKDYSRPALDKHRLGELVDIIGNVDLQARQSGVKDPLGRVYEYFLGRFAAAEGKGGGEFYTPQCVVQLLAKMIEPTRAASLTPVAARVACSCSRNASSKSTVAAWVTSPSTARSQTRPLGNWRR